MNKITANLCEMAAIAAIGMSIINTRIPLYVRLPISIIALGFCVMKAYKDGLDDGKEHHKQFMHHLIDTKVLKVNLKNLEKLKKDDK